jgi:NAD(P)-dependent dehydrogenase (short-subunit alcohol dehydrogenase family)
VLPSDTRSALQQLPRQDPASWLYLPGWRQVAPPPAHPGRPTMAGQNWLVLTDEGLPDLVADAVAAVAARVVRVRPGREFAQPDDGSFVVAPGRPADWSALFEVLRDRDALPDRVLHLWTLTAPDDLDQTLDRGFHSLLGLAQALSAAPVAEVAIDLVTAGTQRVHGTEPLVPARSAAIGPCRVIPLELPWVRCRVVDIVAPEANSGETAPLVEQLLNELDAEPDHPTVATRGARRWVPTHQAMATPALDGPAHLRERGVYLITGGLGGIGLAMAERLANAVKARLVLVGRTALPARDQWPVLLAAPDLDGDVRRRLEAVRRIEAAGGEVLAISADVADEEQVRAVVAAAGDRFGPLHGVIHAAGTPGLGLLQLKTVADARRVLLPKVRGTLVLERVLADQPLDFLALFSSITSITGGGPGQADYCAANLFLDTYAHATSRPDRRVIAVDWGEWQWNAWGAGLLGYDAGVREFFQQNRDRFGISFDEGWESFLRVLASYEPQLVVSTQDFPAIVELSSRFTVETVRPGAGVGPAGARHPRPELSTSYVAPETATERRIAEIWAEALGLVEIGTRDNFFELGGNSLTGVDIVANVRRELRVPHLRPHALYEAPTIAALAGVVDGAPSGEPDEAMTERSGRRREHLRRLKGSRG